MRGWEHHKQRYRLLNSIIRRISFKSFDDIKLHEEVTTLHVYKAVRI